MRRLSIAALLAVSIPAGAAAAPRQPTLRLRSVAPVSVRGAGFAAGERVRVQLLAPERRTRRVRTAQNGTFGAGFGVTADRCGGLEIRAIGNRGNRAALKVRPLCPPG